MCFTRRYRKNSIVFLFVLILAAVVATQGGLRGGTIQLGPASVLAADDPEGDAAAEGEEGREEAGPTPEEAAALVLEGLEEKRQQLLKQEERLAQERELLEKLKKELEAKTEELQTIHSQIESSLAKLEEKETEQAEKQRLEEELKIQKLVKLYSSMKPKKAALIINDMDIVIAEKLIFNMKGPVAGKILAFVESTKAAKISERLAESYGRPGTPR